MKLGDKVKVRRIWAHGEPAAWFGGYEFVSYENTRTCFVRELEGAFAGCSVRYDIADVSEDTPEAKETK
jgi:hypothetical protein